MIIALAVKSSMVRRLENRRNKCFVFMMIDLEGLWELLQIGFVREIYHGMQQGLEFHKKVRNGLLNTLKFIGMILANH
jgi:hypothetical protein